MPIKIDILDKMLRQTNYPPDKREFLYKGFSNGFDIGYVGPVERQSVSDNIPIRIGSKLDMWNKVMKEVKLGRYAGPYKKIPFKNYIQSPIGLIPKDGGTKTQLIFHLSYDFGERAEDRSLNFHTPADICSVKYYDLDHAITTSLERLKDVANCDGEEEEQIFYAKADLTLAFHLVPLGPHCWMLLVLKAEDPQTGKIWFFIDKCLPFGSSRSCAIFQSVSNALQWLTEARAKVPKSVTNYLDDFLFIARTYMKCLHIMQTFLDICSQINCPVSEEKSEWPTQLIIFLGILLDGKHLVLSIPEEKRVKALQALSYVMNKKKVTIKDLQRLTGILNFLGRAIFAGRAFTRRMYTKCSGLRQSKQGTELKDYHHVKVDQELKSNCQVWITFLTTDNDKLRLCRPFVDMSIFETSDTLSFYLDASRAVDLGFGAYFDGRWTYGKWETGYIESLKPSIEYLELYALCIGIFTWQHLLKNCRIVIFCDNQAVLSMVNNTTSSCKNCMILIRLLILNGLIHNRRVFVKYIKSKENFLSDALSRQKIKCFKKAAPPHTDEFPEKLPAEL